MAQSIMQDIIAPIDVNVLKSELTPKKKLRNTNKAGNELYIVTDKDSPNVMKEIGRLREESFRAAGGGTGLMMDIDSFDTMNPPCSQLSTASIASAGVSITTGLFVVTSPSLSGKCLLRKWRMRSRP